MMSVVNTCLNEVNHRLIVRRLPGRLGRISCWHCKWLVWKAGVSNIHKGEEVAVKWTVRREAEGCMILQQGPSDHFLCSWPLGRGSGVERTVPFFTLPWRMALSFQPLTPCPWEPLDPRWRTSAVGPVNYDSYVHGIDPEPLG